MHQFQFGRKVLEDIDSRPPEKMELLVKLSEGGPPLVVYHRVGNQADAKARCLYSNGKFNVLAEPRQDKAACCFPYLSRNAHIETTGMEFPNVLLIATNAARGKWRR